MAHENVINILRGEAEKFCSEFNIKTPEMRLLIEHAFVRAGSVVLKEVMEDFKKRGPKEQI